MTVLHTLDDLVTSSLTRREVSLILILRKKTSSNLTACVSVKEQARLVSVESVPTRSSLQVGRSWARAVTPRLYGPLYLNGNIELNRENPDAAGSFCLVRFVHVSKDVGPAGPHLAPVQ
jgi:hypothetical protein